MSNVGRSNNVRFLPCCLPEDDTADDNSIPFSVSVLRLSILLMICSVATIVAVGLKMRSDFALGVPYGTNKTPHWVLVGGITSHNATFRLRYDGDSVATLTVYQVIDGGVVYTYQTNSSTTEKTIKGLDQVTISDVLQPSTDYKYTLETEKMQVQGNFATPAVEGTPFNFSIVAASCAYSGSKSSIFQEASTAPTASGNKPLFVMHGGDFHYENLATKDIQKRIAAVDKVLLSSTQALLFQSMSLVYMWDDHDWLGNDSTQQGQSQEVIDTALQSYHELFPYYQPLPSQEYSNTTSNNTSPYHAFTIGTIRFILTDLVSENTGDRIFSEAQMEWLLTELKNSSSYDYVVWLSTKPWIGTYEEWNSGWAGHPAERTRISNVIQQYVANKKQNLLVVAGDSHMIAFDDGRNTYYSNQTTSNNTILSFPILQTAPWDNFGSVKGKLYSDGCTTTLYERNKHYSVIDFINEDHGPCIQINSYSTGYNKIFSKRMCGSLFKPIVTNNTSSYSSYISKEASQSCSAPPYLSVHSYIAFGLSFALLIILMVAALLYFSCCEAMWMTVTAIVYYAFSLGLALGLHWVVGVKVVDTFFIGVILLIQVALALGFVLIQGSFGSGAKGSSSLNRIDGIEPEQFPDNKLIRVHVH